MRKAVLAAALLLAVTMGAAAAQISGNYIEARTASVYVGACFANSEAGLVGQEAVLGWQVANGSWNGVPLAGLSVVGVVRAKDTLGATANNPAASIVIVDQKATAEQARALVSFVRSNAPELFSRVLHVERAPIQFQVGESVAAATGNGHEFHGPTARLVVGDFARVVTRAIHHSDATCANAEIYYPPLAPLSQAEPAFVTTHEYKGNGLGSTWSVPNRPSAFVGTFER